MIQINEERKAARLALVEEHVRAETAHDLDALMATFGESAAWVDQSTGEEYSGFDQVRKHHGELFDAFPDFAIEIVRRHVGDQSVVLEVLVRGTQTGTWKGIPPTSKRVELPFCAVITFDDADRMKAEIAYYDRLTVLSQLGVM